MERFFKVSNDPSNYNNVYWPSPFRAKILIFILARILMASRNLYDGYYVSSAINHKTPSINSTWDLGNKCFEPTIIVVYHFSGHWCALKLQMAITIWWIFFESKDVTPSDRVVTDEFIGNCQPRNGIQFLFCVGQYKKMQINWNGIRHKYSYPSAYSISDWLWGGIHSVGHLSAHHIGFGCWKWLSKIIGVI